jgi:hypothetical protein
MTRTFSAYCLGIRILELFLHIVWELEFRCVAFFFVEFSHALVDRAGGDDRVDGMAYCLGSFIFSAYCLGIRI